MGDIEWMVFKNRMRQPQWFPPCCFLKVDKVVEGPIASVMITTLLNHRNHTYLFYLPARFFLQ